ncbi:hypothetical protein pEaSNUABM14_00299 [Erwinia phage pEa_SNUABM_14]|uniref:Uncharacterized protein n=1 Tax=Erwinia phage pEa_SNUABM_7 TaxID=2866695 RepID=A0AAE7WTM8_9CAUD|nr:hypothetical protein MPK74_gp302 [Erwinia phage pEa_SNUABM_7]QYW03258.1 hypothetical protein pEaSNUABM13_00299 [Erwinia phage pEa_SNUABM_13]QYW03599.1 hypothetical protein pEaSNUABM34_00297 [Erwinia phage pEa_SNUABM_34]QYW03940.1 hypothetical protein pEaSNUABM45_00297 [Erwinia phage pEa_SNUABM_45]QYW04281.1 hypothetical protein pEaSNUABM46_00297 [Erwinia phage pEa_SNUABM_46]QYW04624.1 hypothetical protein pEaSNUABM14_00299 [Erwinia phage pEa_SNUABM_14]QYW05312.1 hypothetical protein pEaSNU
MQHRRKVKAESKQRSIPEDWPVFKDMLLTLRIAVLTDEKPHAKLRALALQWYTDGKYRNPVCDSVLLRLTAEKRPKQTLDQLITLYNFLEEE